MDAKEFFSYDQYKIISAQLRKVIEGATSEELDNLHREAAELLTIAMKDYNDAISIMDFRGTNLVLNAIIEEKKVYIHSVDRFLDDIEQFFAE